MPQVRLDEQIIKPGSRRLSQVPRAIVDGDGYQTTEDQASVPWHANHCTLAPADNEGCMIGQWTTGQMGKQTESSMSI